MRARVGACGREVRLSGSWYFFCGVVWCGVVWCGMVWCGVVWRGVVWCGVVWCGVVWCGAVRPPSFLLLAFWLSLPSTRSWSTTKGGGFWAWDET